MDKNENRDQRPDRRAGEKDPAYLHHGVESLVALDNPDDSMLGAERKQTRSEPTTQDQR